MTTTDPVERIAELFASEGAAEYLAAPPFDHFRARLAGLVRRPAASLGGDQGHGAVVPVRP
jgi:hypothetical protein